MEETTWEITAKRYVVFIDIMGFKDMVARMSHDDVYDLMKRIDKIKKHVESVEWIKEKIGYVKTTTYSDSIILYSRDDSYDAFDFLVSTTAGLINYLFIEGIPFKGAIAFGTLTLDTERSIFFGQPLIDAYLLQEEIYFYGILFHSSVEKELQDKKGKFPPFTGMHMCSLKNGTAKHMTIYPLHTRVKENDKFNSAHEALINAVEKLRLKTSGHLRKYIDNTEVYLNEINKSLKHKYN